MKTYTIREISELFSLPASTLRYYESEGLLPVVEKTLPDSASIRRNILSASTASTVLNAPV